MLELRETNATGESIKPYEFDECQPIAGTQINSAGQITITIENQDQFLHLHKSYLLIEGDVLKADNTRYADADPIALAHDELLSLFSSLKLKLSRRINVRRSAAGLGTRPSASSLRKTNRSSGCSLHRPFSTSGIAGRFGGTNAQKSEYAAPSSIQRLKMRFSASVNGFLEESGGGITSSSSDVIRYQSSLSSIDFGSIT